MQAANDNVALAQELRFLSVCSGIEAASVAFGPLGWEAVAFAEIEKFPATVLAHRYPGVPNLGDFTAIDTTTLGRVDVLCGGTPCQAFSVAGKRGSLDDARGNLTLAFVDLAHALADGNGLRNVVWENVPGVLSTKDNAFGCFLAGLVGADDAIEPPARGRWPRHGMVAGPKGRAAWAVKDAQFFGVAQRRRRVLVVADFGNGADPAAVLFEPEGVFRNPPARGEAPQDVAGTIAGGSRKGGGYSTDDVPLISNTLMAGGHANNPSDETIVVMSNGQAGAEIAIDRVPTLTCLHEAPIAAFVLRGISDYGAGAPALRAQGGDVGGGSEALCVTGKVTHALTAEGHDASEDGSGRGAPIVVHGTMDPCVSDDTAFALGRSSGQENVVAFSENIRGEVVETPITRALQTAGGKPGQGYAATRIGSTVRRLTPVECERLQGFPDHYTDIPWRGKPTSPDGPRYKALGNSWAVPKFRWLGERITRLMPAVAANDNQETGPLRRCA